MRSKIKIGVAGGAGYTGGELLRLLVNHPHADIVFVHSRSNAGEPVSKVHTDMLGDTGLHFAGELGNDIDVLFLCVGHGEAKALLKENAIAPHVAIIDLSQDYRIAKDATDGGRTFVYGLPELNRAQIQTAGNIANPGCFATAIQLALLPMAHAGLLSEVHATGITGSTGAGQKLAATSHFSWRANNIEAYKSLTHQHMNEIRQSLAQLQPALPAVNFIPWRGDFTRGIYVTAYTDCTLTGTQAYQLYNDYYATHPFTHVSDGMINLKQVVNTSKCLLHLEIAEGRLIVHSAIDNLLKGASGQAVQNMNLMFGLPEDAGLKLKASSF